MPDNISHFFRQFNLHDGFYQNFDFAGFFANDLAIFIKQNIFTFILIIHVVRDQQERIVKLFAILAKIEC